jgi:hypothetical protein
MCLYITTLFFIQNYLPIMKKRNLTAVLAAAILCISSCAKKSEITPPTEPPSDVNNGATTEAYGSFNVPFNYSDGIQYGSSQCTSDFGSCDYYIRPFNSYTVSQNLQIKLPAGKHNDGGIQARATLNSKQAYTLEYQVKFQPGFQWVKGGKLPGLAGGSAPTGGNTGWDGNGFSARFMWRTNGLLVAYLYYRDQASQYGDDISTGVYLPVNQWVTIKLYVKMNTGSNTNGVLQVWVNGSQKINRSIRWMTNGNRIDKMYLDTFFGGSDASWAPSSDCYIRYDNFKLW